jgi:archaellum biogenesis ATPase FlaH
MKKNNVKKQKSILNVNALMYGVRNDDLIEYVASKFTKYELVAKMLSEDYQLTTTWQQKTFFVNLTEDMNMREAQAVVDFEELRGNK